MSAPLLALRDIAVRHDGRAILDVPALDVHEGEILVVLGPTGAGKSTLLRVMHALLRPETGTLEWRGETVAWPPPLPLRRRIAMAFQDPLPLTGSTFDNVAYGLHVRGLRGAGLRERVEEVLHLFHIEHLAGRRAATLSGGEAQRTALARAVAVRPELLLLDEPLAGLDVPIRKHLALDLTDVIRRYGITCVHVTHDQAEAFAIADRVAILERGRILQTGTPDDVFHRPTGRAVAEFLRTGNILPGVVDGNDSIISTVTVRDRTLSVVAEAVRGARVLACLRPEQVRLDRASAAHIDDDEENTFHGTVTAILDSGATLEVTVDCGFPLVALVTRRIAEELQLKPGRDVRAAFRADAVHLIDDTDDPRERDDADR